MSDTDQAIRDVVKGASVVYVGLFLELLIAFVAQVLAARYLSVSDFGGVTTGTALLDVLSTAGGLGLAAGLTRYLPRVDDKKKRSLATTAVIVTAVVSFTLSAVVSFNASFIAREVFGDATVTSSIRIFGAAIPFAALMNTAIGGIRGQKQSLYQVYVKNFLHPIVRFLFIIGAVTYGLGQAGLASAYAAPYVVSAILALLLLYRSLPKSSFSLNSNLTKDVASYSLPFTITSIAGFVYRSIDIFLILHFLGSFAVGVYGVAYAATHFMRMFSTAFNFLGAPVASDLEHGGEVDEVIRIFQSLSRWLVIGSVCMLVPLGIFSGDFISIVYQSKYDSGQFALTILAIGFAVGNVLGIHGPIIQALGKSRVLMLNSIAAAISNIILNIILIPKFGISGAAAATVFAYLLRDGLATAEVRYYFGTTSIGWSIVGPTILSVPFLGGVLLFIAPTIPGTFLWVLGTSGVLTFLYGSIALLIFGLSETEVMLIRSAEEKYNIRFGIVDTLVNILSNNGGRNDGQ